MGRSPCFGTGSRSLASELAHEVPPLTKTLPNKAADADGAQCLARLDTAPRSTPAVVGWAGSRPKAPRGRARRVFVEPV
jgi:hypothetical protein